MNCGMLQHQLQVMLLYGCVYSIVSMFLFTMGFCYLLGKILEIEDDEVEWRERHEAQYCKLAGKVIELGKRVNVNVNDFDDDE